MSTPVSQVMQSMALLPTHADPSDGELLERFIEQKDDTAFALLMNRHGRMLYAIARRLLKNPADADDVCQAAFLVLARKAPQLERQRSIAGWLVGVVRKLAADVRKMQERRTRHEQLSVPSPTSSHDPSLFASNKEIGQQIDEALARLPRKYREPLLLCYWEGLSKPEATARLGWKPGTLSGRLARGKSLLKLRLERKGIVPTVIFAWFSGAGQSQALPTLVATHAARQALIHLPGVRPMITASIFQLVQGALRSMFLTQAKWVAASLAAVMYLFFLGTGAITLAKADDPPKVDQATQPSAVQPAKKDQEKIQGKWYCVALAMGGSTPEGARKNADVLRDDTWMEFEGDTVRISGSPAEKKGVKYQLRTNASPKQLLIEAGEMKMHGIYSLEDGLLILRFGENASQGNDLPKSFALGQKSSGILFVMQRERSAHQGKAAGNVPLGKMAEPTPLPTTQDNMTKIAIAVHNYAADYNTLPTSVYDKNGKAILSWRVKLLPYLELDNIAKMFKMDEPWDSPHNKELLKNMPAVFKCFEPAGAPAQEANTTPFRAFVGKGTLHEFNKKMNFPDITDATNTTFLFVEAAKAVPWTCPDDLEYDPAKPFPAMGGRFGKNFLAAFCDGSVRELPVPTDKSSTAVKNYFKMVTPAGGEVLDPETAK